MRIKTIIWLLFLGLIISFSCKKDNNSKDYPFRAEVIGLNSDCKIYQIKITEGQDKVESIVGNSVGTHIYIAKNLPEELKVNGLKILLNLRKPLAENDELGVCTAQGLGYTWIFVTMAKRE